MSLNAQVPDSINYYNENAQIFFERTIEKDFSEVYDLFIPHLPKGSKILDAGCGSGRDSQYFLAQGYDVVAFDGSQNMARLARQLTGLTVQHKSFSDINSEEEFDGIWASASLLHVPKSELQDILHKLKKSLKPQGVWYISFRYGEGEHIEDDRYFNDQTEISLRDIMEQLGGIEILHVSVPESLRSHRGYKFTVC